MRYTHKIKLTVKFTVSFYETKNIWTKYCSINIMQLSMSSIREVQMSINQSIKVICNARNVVHKLESEARAVASGSVLMVIEKVGLEVFFESI